jgi:hypothetical protein
MMLDRWISGIGQAALAGLLAGGMMGSSALAGTSTAAHAPAAGAPGIAATPAAGRKKVSPYQPVKLTAAAQNYYMAAWGIDKLKVSYTASGNLIRFSYRVAEAKLAQPLGDERATPSMLGQRSHAVLQVPLMDKVGNLRQTGAQQAGQEYWMVFSNKGDLIKRGDRVNVAIGMFHADGLVVE